MKIQKKTKEKNIKIHDYTKRYWGHDYTLDPTDGGLKASMMGWGYGIEPQDYLLLQNGEGVSFYRVINIKYFQDPKDMWSADAVFVRLNEENFHTFSKKEQKVFEEFFEKYERKPA